VQHDLLIQAKHELEQSEVALVRANRVLAKAKARVVESAANAKPASGAVPKAAHVASDGVSFEKVIRRFSRRIASPATTSKHRKAAWCSSPWNPSRGGGVISGPIVQPGNGA